MARFNRREKFALLGAALICAVFAAVLLLRRPQRQPELEQSEQFEQLEQLEQLEDSLVTEKADSVKEKRQRKLPKKVRKPAPEPRRHLEDPF